MSIIHYAIEIILDGDFPDKASIGLKDNVFRFVTDRPHYDGETVVPVWGDNERESGDITYPWYEDLLTRDGITQNPSREIDVTMGGNYGTLSGLTFTLRNDVEFLETCALYGINICNRQVNFYAIIDNVFYQFWSGVVSNNPVIEETFQFVCQDNSQQIHKTIPPNVISPTAYPDSSNQGDAIPVCIGNVPHAELKNVKNLLKETNAIDLNLIDEVHHNITAARTYDDNYSGGLVFLSLITIGVFFEEDSLIGHYLMEKGENKLYKIIANGPGTGLYVNLYLAEKLAYDKTTFNSDYTYIMSGLDPSGPRPDTKWFQIFNPDIEYKFSQIETDVDNYGAEMEFDGEYPAIETYNKDLEQYESVGGMVDISETELKFLTNDVNFDGSVDNYSLLQYDISHLGLVVSSTDPTTYGDFTDTANPELYDKYRLYNSTSSQAIVGSGTITIRIQSGLSITTSNKVYIEHDSSHVMYGTVSSYNSSNGDLTISVIGSAGSGTYNSWNVYLGQCYDHLSAHNMYIGIDLDNVEDIKGIDNFCALLDAYVANPGHNTINVSIAIQSKDIFGKFNTISSFTQIASSAYDGTNQLRSINLIPNFIYNLRGGLFQNDIKMDYNGSIHKITLAESFLEITNSIRIWFKFSAGTNRVVIKEFVFCGVKTFDTIQGSLYARIEGEKVGYYPDGTINSNSTIPVDPCTLSPITPTNDVYHALMHILEDYDGISKNDIDYGNLALYRIGSAVDGSNWYVGRQLIEQRNSLEYLIELARQSFVGIFTNRLGKKKLTAWLEDNIATIVHNQDNTVRDSISGWEQTDVTQLFNEFTLNYAYNPATQKYDKSFSVKHTDDTRGFPLMIGDPYGRVWTDYFSGFEDLNYDNAKTLWEQCHTSWLKNKMTQMADSSVSECPWFIDNTVFGYGVQDTTYWLLERLIRWTTRQKDTVNFAIPISPTCLEYELLMPLTFADIIYTDSVARLSWFYRIELDVRNNNLILSVIFNPPDEYEDTVVIERGIPLNDDLQIVERGIPLNDGSYIIET